MIDTLGHIFYAILLAGMVCLAAGWRIGWWFRIIGELGWVGLGLALGLSSIVIWGLIFVAIDLYGNYKWAINENRISKS
jgi:hypothetical protein